MAATPVSFQADSGLTLTVKLEATPDGAGVPVGSGYAATEKTTAKGWYGITINGALTGLWYWHAEDGSGNIVANGLLRLGDTTDTYYAFDPVDPLIASLIVDYSTDLATLLNRIGTPADLGSGANVGANLVDIEAQTQEIGTAGAGLTNVPWNASWDAEVQSEVADALTAYDVATVNDVTSLDGSSFTLIPWNSAWDAQVQSEVVDGLTEFGASTEANVNVVKDQAVIAVSNTQK